jgi:hypothetical protein
VRTRGGSSDGDGKPEDGESPHPSIVSHGRPIWCRACTTRVTWEEMRIEVAGAHRHTFTNSDGETFEIGCFSTVPGCRVEGEATLEGTWFDGYSWSYAHCSNCTKQLGWYYEADGRFFGLILERLMP